MSYIRVGNRISLLPVSQYCGLAPKLSEEHGAGRAAAMSSAFHAKSAAADDAKEKLARLTPKELDEIQTWKTPTPVTVNGHELTYEGSEKEQPVGITDTGEWADSGPVLTCGTLDFAWVHGGVAYVGDMKKTRWTTSGPDTLQLLAYGYAWAKKHNCRAFVPGLWIIEDSEWVWGDVVDLEGFDALDLWSRIAFAASNNDGRAAMGDHCGNCYGRLHCPEYTLPAVFADTKLSAVAEKGMVTPERLAEALEYVQRMKEIFAVVEEQGKEHARRAADPKDPTTWLKHPKSGKLFKPIPMAGRESLNRARLFADIPGATKYLEKGNPYTQFRWVNDGPTKKKAASK